MLKASIKAGFAIGHDSHTINHFHTLQVQPFSSGHFIDYLIHRRDVNVLWRAFTQHKFVRAIGDGSLPLDVFKRFLAQDYLYLTQFARTNALAAYKSNDMEEIAASAKIVLGVQKEMALHLEYCQDFGISKQEMEATRESQATIAYSRYVLDVGQSGDWLGLQVAMASCLLGYQAAAEWLKAQPGSKREDNRYWKWVDNYGGEEYAEGVRLGREMIEKHASKISPQRVEELVRIFIRVTEMEINFWEFDAHSR
jgi:thiaminase II